MANYPINRNFIQLCCLFFCWAVAHNLNPILIPQIKLIFQLSDFQSAWVDSAFYIAYTLFALPAGLFIGKFGYKKGIQFGLFLFAMGALITGYSTLNATFPSALFALFILAIGLTFLETSANPLVTLNGDASKANQRLNFAQSFNGLGATLAAFFGGQLIFSNHQPSITLNQIEQLKINQPYQFDELMEDLSLPVWITYTSVAIGIAALLVLVTWLFKENNPNQNASTQQPQPQLSSLLKNKKFTAGLATLGLYVGAQIGIGSFFIRYAQEYTQLDKNSASVLLSIGLLLFMVGRFIGSSLMSMVKPAKLLEISASLAAVLIGFAIVSANNNSPINGLYCLVTAQFFMSIMFPTIFSLSLQQVDNPPPLASSLLIMTIGGGALMPPVMGAISDQYGLNYAFLLPFIAFLAVSYFSYKIIKTA